MKVLFVLAMPFLAFLAVVGGLFAFYVFRFRYKTAASDEVLVITGPNLRGENVYKDENGRSVKIQRGGGYRLRMFQTAKAASLHSFQIHIETPTVRVKHGIPVVAKAVATIKVADKLEDIVKYAEQFMGKKEKEIKEELTNVLSAKTRSILGTLEVEDLLHRREEFDEKVSKATEQELKGMGFTLVSFGLEDVRDAEEDGYLKNLGRPKIAIVKEEAEKAEAEAQKNIYINKAENLKVSKEEEVKRQMEIAEIEKDKELLVQRNLAETNRERALSEQVYELERAKAEREVEQERLKIELIKRSELLKQAEIDKNKSVLIAQQESEIALIAAEANKNKAIREGEALAESKRIQEETEAEIIIKRGEAEAKSILMRGEAEAKAKYEMSKAIKEYGEVAIVEMILKTMPEIAKEVAKSYESVSDIKIIDMGNGEGANSMSESVLKNMTSLQHTLGETTGIDLKNLIETFVARGLNVSNENSKENVSETAINVAALEQKPSVEEKDKVESETEVNLEEN